MKKIGLTGGIGAGKSTVSKIFDYLGVPVYNSDLVSKNILLHNNNVSKKIISILGKTILTYNKIDLKKISKIIFNNKEKLNKVNEILHNEVKIDYQNWIKKQQSKYIVKESAIIYESKIDTTFDKIIFVSGTKSSNGNVLYNVCKSNNKHSHFVSSSKELKNEWFNKNESVGICGATSTPMWLMEDIKTKILTF